MKKTLLICAVAAAAAACHDDGVRRDQPTYQTVQEGTSTAVTSTINAPGAVTAPMTATNADTTSNLSLPVATTGSAFGQPGSLAGTMNASRGGSMSVPYPSDTTVQGSAVVGGTPRSAPRTAQSRPAAPSAPAPTQPMTSATPERPRHSVQPAPEPAPTEPTETFATPAPSTDTTTTTSTEGTPAKQKEKPKEAPAPPPPSTDTSTTTSPPPPTQT